MSGIGISILLLWTGLLGIWVVRLSAARLYPERPGVQLWITLRVLLRWGLGAFAVLAWESYRRPDPPPGYALVVDSACPEVWEPSARLAKEAFARQYRLALLAITPRSAFWAIPPTQDSTLFFFLLARMTEKAEASASLPAMQTGLRQLRPYIRSGELVSALWLGRFASDSLPYPHWLLCQDGQTLHTEGFPFPAPPLRDETLYGLGFLFCAALLLVGEGYFYLLRKHLPLRTQA